MLKLFLLSVALFIAVSSGAERCGNVLFANNPEINKHLLAEPAEPTNDFCDLPGKSCCKDESITKLEELFNKAQADLDAAEKAIADAERPKWDDMKTQVKNSALPQDKKDKLLDVIDNMEGYYEDLGNNAVDCMQGVIVYTAGMYCFACHANWENYIQNADNPPFTVNFHTNTCDKMVDACVPLFDTMLSIVKEMTELFSALLGGVLELGDAGFQDTFCGGDCSAHICNSFIGGYQLSLPSASVLDIKQRSAIPEEHLELYNNVVSIADDHVDIFNSFSKRNSLNTKETLANTINNDGYDAYQAGIDSGFDTGGSGAGVVIAVVIILLIVIAAGVGGFLFYKKKH